MRFPPTKIRAGLLAFPCRAFGTTRQAARKKPGVLLFLRCTYARPRAAKPTRAPPQLCTCSHDRRPDRTYTHEGAVLKTSPGQARTLLRRGRTAEARSRSPPGRRSPRAVGGGGRGGKWFRRRCPLPVGLGSDARHAAARLEPGAVKRRRQRSDLRGERAASRRREGEGPAAVERGEHFCSHVSWSSDLPCHRQEGLPLGGMRGGGRSAREVH